MMTLTLANNGDNLALLLPHEAVGFGHSFSKGAIAVRHLVHGFFNAYSFMVGVPGSLSACRLLCPADQPSTSAALSLVTSDGSLKTTAKEFAMSQHSHTPKLTKENKLTIAVSDKSKSRFNVLTRSGRSIARKVPFATAISLKAGHPEFTIKFDSMGAQS